jgi:hypothetical protein
VSILGGALIRSRTVVLSLLARRADPIAEPGAAERRRFYVKSAISPKRRPQDSGGQDSLRADDSIVCIGALIAHRESDSWEVDALGAPHVGARTEKVLT